MSIDPSGPSRPHFEGAGAPRPGPAFVRAEKAPIRGTPTPPRGPRLVGDDSLSAERLMALRGRVLDGSYDAPVIIESIARALIRRRVLA